jgi:predicted dehydrogenase
VGVIGCGQFAFATIGYFLKKSGGYRFAQAYDSDAGALVSFCEFYKVGRPAKRLEDLDFSQLDIVYIASNHASHAEYAIRALSQGVSVYVEKPLSVNWDQFRALGKVFSENKADVFVGYNRPFSQPIARLKQFNAGAVTPLSLSCFVVGHFIDSDHWYRDPNEGTRVCGNLGHWLDLSVHLLCTKQLPEFLDIRVAVADPENPDDNLAVSLVSSSGDLINLVLTSRAEPFEGINETISFNQDDLIATITDFREARFWKGHRYLHERYRPKDVGHKKAILQHLHQRNYRRNLDEVRISTALMLEVKDMVLSGTRELRFFPAADKYIWT